MYSVQLDDDVLHGHLTSDATENVSILRAKSSGERVLLISIIFRFNSGTKNNHESISEY